MTEHAEIVAMILAAHKAGRDEQYTLLDNAQQAIDSNQREIADLSKQLRLACSRAHDAERDRETLAAEVDRLQSELEHSKAVGHDVIADAETREEMAQAFVEDIREELGCSHTEILQAIRRLQAENLRLEEENTAYSFASAFTREHLEDARLGRLVKAMPRAYELYHTSCGIEWRVQNKFSDSTQKFAEKAEDALVAAGVQDPQQETTAR